MIINDFEKRLFKLVDEIDAGILKEIDNNEEFDYKVYSYDEYVSSMEFKYDLFRDCKYYDQYIFHEEEGCEYFNGDVQFYMQYSYLDFSCPAINLFFEIEGFNEAEELIWVQLENFTDLKLNNSFDRAIRKAKKIYEEHIKLKDLVKESESTGKTKRRI